MKKTLELSKLEKDRTHSRFTYMLLCSLFDKIVQSEEYKDRCLCMGQSPECYNLSLVGVDKLIDDVFMSEMRVTEESVTFIFDIQVFSFSETQFIAGLDELRRSYYGKFKIDNRFDELNKRQVYCGCDLSKAKQKENLKIDFEMLLLFNVWNFNEYIDFGNRKLEVCNVPDSIDSKSRNYFWLVDYIKYAINRTQSLDEVFNQIKYTVKEGSLLDLSMSDGLEAMCLQTWKNTTFRINFSNISFIKRNILRNSLVHINKKLSGAKLNYPLEIMLDCFDGIPLWAKDGLDTIKKDYAKCNIHIKYVRY